MSSITRTNGEHPDFRTDAATKPTRAAKRRAAKEKQVPAGALSEQGRTQGTLTSLYGKTIEALAESAEAVAESVLAESAGAAEAPAEAPPAAASAQNCSDLVLTYIHVLETRHEESMLAERACMCEAVSVEG